MVPQTETKTGAGFKAGVKDYRLTYFAAHESFKKRKYIIYFLLLGWFIC